MALSKYEAYEYQNPMKLVIVRPTLPYGTKGAEGIQLGSSSPKSSLEFSPSSKKIGKPIQRPFFCDLDFSDEQQHPSSKSPHGVRFFYLINPHHKITK